MDTWNWTGTLRGVTAPHCGVHRGAWTAVTIDVPSAAAWNVAVAVVPGAPDLRTSTLGFEAEGTIHLFDPGPDSLTVSRSPTASV